MYVFVVCSRYEGTGRSLSLKLIQQLRHQNVTFGLSGKTQSKESSDAGTSATGQCIKKNQMTLLKVITGNVQERNFTEKFKWVKDVR